MKTYTELITKGTFLDRYRYLKVNGKVSEETFGSERLLNQTFYRSKEWKQFRNSIILRDGGYDLGVEGYDICGPIYIHHINPISVKDIYNRNLDVLLNPDNVICVSFNTHEAIHYGDESMFIEDINRQPNDTCPWKEVKNERNTRR